jgi:ABC-type branched-subunit amino acid transport system ATPase component
MPDPTVGAGVCDRAVGRAGPGGSVTILRGSDLTRLMVTLGTALLLLELANKLDWLTGGADGLQGVVMGPVLGFFEFDLYGRTAAWYSLAVMLVLFLLMRRLVHSPFGATLKAIRDNRLRAMAIGIPVVSRLATVYTIAAGVAGAAGALLAQTTGFASLDVLAFDRSADVLLMLVIGGVGWLYGGVAGAIVFKLLQDTAVGRDAAVLDVLDRPDPGAAGAGRPRPAAETVDLVRRGQEEGRERWCGMTDTVLSAHGLVMRFGGITATNNVTLELQARRAPCAHRPQRRRQDHADQPADRRAHAHRGPHHAAGRGHHQAGAAPRVARGLVRTFQINQLFDSMTPLETLALVVSQHRASARNGGGRWAPVRPWPNARCSCSSSSTWPTWRSSTVKHLAYGKRRLLEIAIALACEPRVLLLDEPVAGVPAGEREELLQTVAALPADVSVLLIEHDMDLVFSFADRMTVLVNGTLLTEGDAGTKSPTIRR